MRPGAEREGSESLATRTHELYDEVPGLPEGNGVEGDRAPGEKIQKLKKKKTEDEERKNSGERKNSLKEEKHLKRGKMEVREKTVEERKYSCVMLRSR